MEKKIFDILNKIGIPCNLNGRTYIETGIKIVAQKQIISVTKELYPEIARKHNTTPQRVERGIRVAIEAAFDNGDMDVLQKIFGNTIGRDSGKVVNSAFIFGLEKYLKINCEEN